MHQGLCMKLLAGKSQSYLQKANVLKPQVKRQRARTVEVVHEGWSAMEPLLSLTPMITSETIEGQMLKRARHIDIVCI